MNLKIIILSELNQTERQLSYDITNMWNLKKMMHTNLFTKYVTDLDNKLNSYQKDKVCVGGGGGNKLGGWD